MTRVYVGGLPPDIRPEDLTDVFRRYDPLRVDMKAGFCFIEFREARDADDAIHDMDGFKVDGRRLIVQPAKGTRRTREDYSRGGGGGGFDDRGRGGGFGGRPPFGGPGPRKGDGYQVEVEGLDSRTSWQDLKDFARGAGNVTFADVFVENGKKMGVIEYATRDDMENALKRLDDTKLDGALVRLYPIKRSAAPRSRERDRSPRRDRSPSPRGRSPVRGGRSPSPRRERKEGDRSRSPAKRSRSPPPRERSPPPRERSPVRERSPPRSPGREDAGGLRSPDRGPRL